MTPSKGLCDAPNLPIDRLAARDEPEAWQRGEIQASIAQLDVGRVISHDRVAKWLKSWGTKAESKAPR